MELFQREWQEDYCLVLAIDASIAIAKGTLVARTKIGRVGITVIIAISKEISVVSKIEVFQIGEFLERIKEGEVIIGITAIVEIILRGGGGGGRWLEL